MNHDKIARLELSFVFLLVQKKKEKSTLSTILVYFFFTFPTSEGSVFSASLQSYYEPQLPPTFFSQLLCTQFFNISSDSHFLYSLTFDIILVSSLTMSKPL